jgi:small-conductance mechanosensitive channel
VAPGREPGDRCDPSLGSAVWVARLFGYDVLDPAIGGFTETVLRPLFKAAATLAVAWLVWATIGGFLGGRAPNRVLLGDEDAAMPELTGVTRLATLLPLIRNTLAIAIFFLGAVIALGDLGVNIGPLLAGAGVVGIALGFGAQALVRDVIAGLFFLIDDAFRLGEYIDTGRLKGTVEAISIRSVPPGAALTFVPAAITTEAAATRSARTPGGRPNGDRPRRRGPDHHG